MTPSDPNPKLPLWIFFVTDAVLIGAAAIVAHESARPLSTTAVLAIVSCVIVGGIVALVPLVSRYERAKNEALDDRQRALEALARTVSTSAEQISIATNGLNEISDHIQRSLRHAEHLPHKLHEKIAEFQAQLANAEDAEKEEMEKELVALRTTESERLESVSDRIAKTTAELAKLESATHQHLAATTDALAKLNRGTADAIAKAQAAAEHALAHARTEAARGLGDSAGQAARAIDTAKATALAEIDAKLAAAGDAFIARVTRELTAALSALAAATPAPGPAATPAPAPEAAAGPPASTEDSPKTESTAHPPKRPRKPRREESAADETAPAEPATGVSAVEIPAAVTPDSVTAPEAPVEPPPIPAEKIPEVAPVAPDTADPFVPPAVPASEVTPAAAAATPPAEPAKPPRKRAARKPADAPDEADKGEAAPAEPALDLGLDDSPAPSGLTERVLTSDGATRLLVTAYIGIGNRLFIRGAGPGLSWEKGVPLQFVSIGKWRWETNDATGPIQFKLYKNDELECAALGAQSVDPGYQQELSATF